MAHTVSRVVFGWWDHHDIQASSVAIPLNESYVRPECKCLLSPFYCIPPQIFGFSLHCHSIVPNQNENCNFIIDPRLSFCPLFCTWFYFLMLCSCCDATFYNYGMLRCFLILKKVIYFCAGSSQESPAWQPVS